ncbi:hypothetical protein [Herbaspirillum rubrisubalbicans]|uniref:hypothetical protein n=1 Tax=Herbaspirillum rubrisubalbicans TaxID=80842 RepID=UPI000AA14D6F|nr:hypothetical protein [Herbaspirillum rubrisubalbicans]
MDQKIPFTSYDFWAYLSAGFLLLFALDQVAESNLLMRESWTVVQGVIAMSSAYVVGQMIASFSSFVFERLLVGKVLGSPSNTLFAKTHTHKFLRYIFFGYFQPLPEETQLLLLEKSRKLNIQEPGLALFAAAHTRIKGVPAVADRLANFLNLYGFCRNVAFVAIFDSGLLCWSYLFHDGPKIHLWISLISAFVAVAMLFRYLKFFRHYAIEVFNSYAYAEEDKEKNDTAAKRWCFAVLRHGSRSMCAAHNPRSGWCSPPDSH